VGGGVPVTEWDSGVDWGGRGKKVFSWVIE
jgi:hypothetical protein